MEHKETMDGGREGSTPVELKKLFVSECASPSTGAGVTGAGVTISEQEKTGARDVVRWRGGREGAKR